MKTLLHINSYLGSGSIGRIIEQISGEAEKDGWNCFVAAGSRYAVRQSVKTLSFDVKFSEWVHYVISVLMDKHGRGSFLETLILIYKIKKIRPDVVHLHNLHGYYLNIRLLCDFLTKRGIPVVWTFHDCWPITGHCVHFDMVGCNKWMEDAGCRNCVQKHFYPYSLIDRSSGNFLFKKRLFTRFEKLTIVTVSEWLKSVVSKSFFKNYPIRRIYNGVDLDVFRFNPASSLNLHNNCRYVLLAVAAVWSERKGYDDYCEVRMLLPPEYKIVLIGLNEKQINALPSGIIGINRTNDVKELVDYYSEADIVLNLSYEETLGMTTIEGLACGKPSIVYDRTASPELVTEETGIVVQAGDVLAVAKAIEKICSGNSVITDEACRKRAEQYFGKNERYAEYVALYDEVLRQHKAME